MVPTTDAALEAAPPDQAPRPDVSADVFSAEDTARPPAPPPAVDGLFDDWVGLTPLATDPAGDALGAFDVIALWAQSRGTQLFVRLVIAGQPLNLSSGAPEEGTLRLELRLPEGRPLTVAFRERVAYPDKNPSAALRWSDLEYESAPTYASTDFELTLNLASLGVQQGQTIQLDVSGGDQLAAPVSFTLAEEPLAPEERPAQRLSSAAVRLASLNTQFDGLTDPQRSLALGRLVRAAAADLYCLQELFATEAGTLASALKTIDPLGDGATWHVHRSGDTAIASRWPLVPLPRLPALGGQQRFTGAAIQLNQTQALVVFSLRLTCCGYIGNAADLTRIAEAEALASTIAALRQGALGAELVPFAQAPVVVFGDWNLVGSRTPLDRLLDPAGPGLYHLQLRHLVGLSTYTWRSDAIGSFPPGLLDLLAYGAAAGGPALEPLSGFVLDSEKLSGQTRGVLGLERDDSLGSDHLLLVADFELN